MSDDYMKDIIDPGDRASALGKEVCFESHGNCPAVEIIPRQLGNFRGPVDFRWIRPRILEMAYEDLREKIENDGAGGKPQFFTILADPDVMGWLGWEIITMTADDVARSGGFPAIMLNQIDIKGVTNKNFYLIEALMKGYGNALRTSNLVNITGEVAIMKHSITCFLTGDLYNTIVLTWSGACLGLSRPDKYLDSANIKPDMFIVGFHERGYRCNGGTFFTNLITKKWGTDISEIQNNPDARKFISQLTVPSWSYAKTLTRLLGWNPDGSVTKPMAQIRLASHITGGGVWGKFGEVLPPDVTAILDRMPTPPLVLRQAQEMGKEVGLPLSDWSAYSTFHGGCGMLLVVDDINDAEIVIAEAKKDLIEASIVGATIERKESSVIIISQFSERDKTLYSNKSF